VFTAQYALSPCIKEIHFAFKGLIHNLELSYQESFPVSGMYKFVILYYHNNCSFYLLYHYSHNYSEITDDFDNARLVETQQK
jgi:hypothetical protein